MDPDWSPSTYMLEERYHRRTEQQIRRKPISQQPNYNVNSASDSSVARLLYENDYVPPSFHPGHARAEADGDTKPKPSSTLNNLSLSRTNSLRAPTSARASFKHIASEWWLVEFAFLGLALASLVALVIVLYKFNNQPQKAWPYSVITLNSLVSFLAACVRAASMVPVADALSQGIWLWFRPPRRGFEEKKTLADVAYFDSASRGPWGSARLLWRTKGRHSASLGAVVVLLAIAIDPLSQLLLSVEYRNIDTTDAHAIASIPQAERYASWGSGTTQSTPNLILPMVAAISNGMYTGGLGPLGVSCPTGNCTWPTAPTLAVCSDCRNITANLTSTCDGPGPNVTHCNSSLPNGAYLYGTRGNSLDPVMNVTSLLGPSQALAYTNETYPYVLIFNILASERLPRGGRGNVSAYECAIWFCTQAYAIFVQNGQLVQSTI